MSTRPGTVHDEQAFEDDWLAGGTGLDWGDPRSDEAPLVREPRGRKAAPAADMWFTAEAPAPRERDDDELDDLPRGHHADAVARRRQVAGLVALGVAIVAAIVVVAVVTSGGGTDTSPALTTPTTTDPTTPGSGTTQTTTPITTTPVGSGSTTTTPAGSASSGATTDTGASGNGATTDTTAGQAGGQTTDTTTTGSTAGDASTTGTISLPAAGKLKLGDTGALVTALQQALAQLDYEVGTPDGTFGEGTKAAVIAFQTAQGLTPDGVVGPGTAAKLEAVLAGDTGATSGDSTTGDSTGTTTAGTVSLPDAGKLKAGDTGDLVTALQQALAQLDYQVGTPDGTFGQATTDAVVAFQTAQGLTPDGIVGPTTADRINAVLAGTAPAQASGSTDSATTTPQTPAQAASVSLPAAGRLASGDTGDEVKTLQEALALLDYEVGTPDGTFGEATRTAVAAFQTAQGLTPDGVVGPTTAERINAALASTLPAG